MATEKRLIDVCAETRKIEEVLAERKEQAGSLTYRVFEAVKTALEKAPTIDAVPVVRCKDCKHNGMAVCPIAYIEKHTLQFINHDGDFFCRDGERKDGEG